MRCITCLLLCAIHGVWCGGEAFAAKANLKALYTAEKAFSLPGGLELHFGSFDLTFDFNTPPPGGSITGFFDVFTEISLNGGPFVPLAGSGSQIHHDTTLDYFAGELLSMELMSPPGSPAALLRESPTLQSLGQTKLITVGGVTQVESFFDVFAELSLDDGNTWLPITPSIQIGTVPEPASLTLLGSGVGLLLYWERRHRRKSAIPPAAVHDRRRLVV